MKSESTLQVLNAKISDTDHKYLRERADAMGLSMSGVIRHIIAYDRKGPGDRERQAHPSYLDGLLRGRLFALCVKGIETLNLPKRQQRVAVVDAEAFEECIAVLTLLLGSDPRKNRADIAAQEVDHAV